MLIDATVQEKERVDEIFLDKMHTRLTEMMRVFESGSWSSESKKVLVSGAFLMSNEGQILGYKLFADIAKSMCYYCEGEHQLAHPQRIVIAKHLEVLRAILEQNISGAGGEVGKDVYDNLQLLIKKFQSN